MLKRLIVKEVKDLIRDRKILFGMIILPLIIYGVMGIVVSETTKYSIQQVKEAVSTGMKLAVVDYDKSTYSKLLIEYLKRMNTTIDIVNRGNINVTRLLASKDYIGVLVIPQGFSKNISMGIQGSVEVYVRLSDISIASLGIANAVIGLVNGFAEYLSSILISNTTTLPPSFVMNPIEVQGNIIIGKVVYSLSYISAMYSQMFMLPLAPMIVMIYAASIAATSIGVEKEEKTLEVLLTLPISRKSIALAKLTGSIIIALAASISTMAGFYLYMKSITEVSTSSQSSVGTNVFGVIGIGGLIVYALTVFLTVMVVSTLGLYLGSFGENVRSAQSVVGYLWLVVFIPLYASMFIDFSLTPLPVVLAISMIPFTSPLVALKSFIVGNYTYLVVNIVATIALLILLVFLVSRRFEGEKLLIGRPGKRRGRKLGYKFFKSF